jgi:hypothetical protein
MSFLNNRKVSSFSQKQKTAISYLSKNANLAEKSPWHAIGNSTAITLNFYHYVNKY